MAGMAECKQRLRKSYLNKRGQLTAAEKNRQSGLVRERLAGWERLSGLETVLFYAPIKNELDLLPLLEDPEFINRRILFPRVCGERLELCCVSSSTELREGFCKIPEPCEKTEIVSAGAVDAAFIPGVVFDRRGYRIGYGGGYYDRLLSRHADWLTVGIAYQFQLQDELPVEEHDVRLKALCTPQGIGLTEADL